MDQTIRILGFNSWWELGIIPFTITSRTGLEPTQPLIHRLPGALSLGSEADHISQCRGQECVELYLHSSNTSSWRGAWLSTGASLPLPLPKGQRDVDIS